VSEAADAVTKVWTIRDLLQWSRAWFDERGVDSARLTSELLLAHVLNCPRIKLYADFDRPLEKPELARYKELVQRRARGEPTQYVIGTTDFYGRTFKVDKRALIPRPETELVAERLLRAFPKDAAVRLADTGCGCGTLGLTLAAERPNAHVVLTDVSPDAAALAAENAENLRLSGRVEIRVGDLATPLGDELFDAVVANLPYVPDALRTTLPVHIRDHEPHLALFSGADGLDLYRRYVPAIARHLKPGGLLVVEHGEEHGESLPALFDPALWETPVVEKDLAGLTRFTWAVRRA
jgi:release factor glutamine methyltransferase